MKNLFSVARLVLVTTTVTFLLSFGNTEGRAFASSTAILDVPSYNQNTQLKSCRSGVVNQGCALTAIAMVFRYFGANTNPENIYQANSDRCNAHWGSLDKSKIPNSAQIHFDVSLDNYAFSPNPSIRVPAQSAKIVELINNGIPVIVGDDNYKGVLGRQHWVVITGYTEKGAKFLVNDPDGGTQDIIEGRHFSYMKVYRGNIPKWTQTPAIVSVVSGDPKGNAWVTTPNQDVFKFDRVLNQWSQIPGKLVHIAAGGHIVAGGHDEVWGVNQNNQVFRYNHNGTWTQIPGIMRMVSVGENGEVWGVTPNNDVFRYNRNGTWTQMPGIMRSVSVLTDNEVWGVTPNNDVFRYLNGVWTQHPGIMREISVGWLGQIYGVTPNNDVFFYHKATTRWTQDHGAIMRSVSVGGEGTRWGVTPNNHLFMK